MTKKIAVITGTSSGFGLLSALELARHGFQVVATMRDLARKEALDKAAATTRLAEQINVRRLDVTDFGSMAEFVERVVHNHGRIDVLVNNAGFAVAGFVEDLKMEEIRLQFETNFFGAVALTKAVLPRMRAQHSGHIIMVSSVAGLLGSPQLSSYSASKHALEGWSESLRFEVSSLGIKVVLVEPGSYETDIWTRGAYMGEKDTDLSSPNVARSLRMRETAQKIKKRDPNEVARLIAQVADDPNPRLRYLVGPDAKIQVLLKRVLPWKVHEKLVARAMGLD